MRQRLFPWIKALCTITSWAALVVIGIEWWQFGFDRPLPLYVFALIFAVHALQFAERWADPNPTPQAYQPSQAVAGAGVVLVCGLGLSAAAMVATEAGSMTRYLLPVLGIIATLACTAIVYRFASRHEGEIGEARFRTTPERNPDG